MKRIFCTAIFAIVTASATIAAEANKPPVLEDYLRLGRANEFLQQASEYIIHNPNSEYAPSLLLDVYVLGTVTEKEGLISQARENLLFDYTNSFQGRFIINTFEDASDFRNFVDKAINKRLTKSPQNLPRQFDTVFRAGYKRYGREIFSDNDFMLEAFYLANLCGDTELSSAAFNYLKQSDDKDYQQAVAVMEDTRLSKPEIIQRFHQMKEIDSAEFVERLLMTRLTDAELCEPAMLQIRAEIALDNKKFAEVLPLLDQMPEELQNEPHILFWKGSALFALNRDAEAISVLEEAAAKNPDDPWAQISREYMTLIRDLDKNLSANIEALLGSVRSLKAGIGQIEVKLRFVPGPPEAEKTPYDVYIACMPARQMIEFCGQRGGEMLLGYKSTGTSSSVYTKGQNQIDHFNLAGPVPVLTAKLEKRSSGEYYFSFETHLGSFTDFARTNSSLLDSPYISTRDGLREMLDHITRNRGWLPAGPKIKNDTIAFGWIKPGIAKPQMKRLRYQTTADFRLRKLAVNSEDGSLEANLRYGAEGDFQLIPQQWPDLPVAERGEAGLQVFISMMNVIKEVADAEKANN